MMKKAVSILLALVLLCSVIGVGVFAASGDTYSLTNTSVTVDGTSDKTVNVNLVATKAGTVYGFQGVWATSAAEGKIVLSELTPAATVSPSENSASTGNVLWLDSSYSAGISVEADGPIWNATFTVDKDTPAGEYPVTLDVSSIVKDSNKGDKGIGTLTGMITVTNNTVSNSGYTVALSSDAPAAGVAKGKPFNINLNVTNTEATKFNAFYGTLTYDSAKVTYDGGETVGDFKVDSSTAGKLIISRSGSDVTINASGPELVLPFTAAAAGDASFTLMEAKVDVKEQAELRDAPDATVSGSPLSVKVLETYTITFEGGDGATGDAPTMDPVAAGTKIELPANTFTKEGWSFSEWSDGSAGYREGAEYTMPAGNVTFTAQWTKDIIVTPASANPTAYFGSQYKLIAATINASGYVPTYDDNEMFQVQGYDDNTWYYVIDGTYDSSKFGYKAGTAVTITKPDNDVNQTGIVDINDAQFVYNIYNGTAPTQNIVQRLLLADTNRDKTVNTQDCAVVVQAI